MTAARSPPCSRGGSINIVFETHALTEDNERGFATGWLPGRLSERGRSNAADMGRRRRDDGIAAVFSSDLRRAADTAEIAFGATTIPILYDWRLRECDFGERNGSPSSEVGRDRLATYRALEHAAHGRTIHDLVAETFEWRPEGWEYTLD
uniref:histidine phosphatase family protein n=1 Tax=Paractinoplanes polyasparticus TaxID=2856853 RepID=UPI001C85EEBD|nr:histidine phosphatase family protein [Actinoplanes polyasparticus]